MYGVHSTAALKLPDALAAIRDEHMKLKHGMPSSAECISLYLSSREGRGHLAPDSCRTHQIQVLASSR
jgi:hypothetical protein